MLREPWGILEAVIQRHSLLVPNYRSTKHLAHHVLLLNVVNYSKVGLLNQWRFGDKFGVRLRAYYPTVSVYGSRAAQWQRKRQFKG